ncbi:hypothetical protein ANN_24633 [Periplaneta americana]|uniref:Uncharacterized protein n=1 Tax=Periplaneta americana TaxID=6978 RepID=A0ABQ8S3J1_PERAM|nr:hypothetical protein ANN_24633 [Periplaneta americana]
MALSIELKVEAPIRDSREGGKEIKYGRGMKGNKRIVWREEEKVNFNNLLEDKMSVLQQMGIQKAIANNLDKAVKLLYHSIERASRSMMHSLNGQRKIENGSWYDLECIESKKRYKKAYRKWRGSNSRDDKKAFLNLKKEYKDLLLVKKKTFAKNELNKLNVLISNNNISAA